MNISRSVIAFTPILAFAVAMFTGVHEAFRSAFLDVHAELCDLVAVRYYQSTPELERWVDGCRKKTARLPNYYSKKIFAEHFNRDLATLGVSHLYLFTPEENLRTWDNEGLETGIRVRLIEESFVIFRLLPGSPAVKAGLRVGDEVLGIDGYRLVRATDAESESGTFHIRRNPDERLQVEIAAVNMQEDRKPVFTRLADGSGLLTISSFLAPYFEQKQWTALAHEIQVAQPRQLIVDVRENPGGNFAAMVRGLSLLFCQPQVIGEVGRFRAEKQASEVTLEDRLEAARQIEQIEKNDQVVLKTFSGYPCYDGPVTVLIDSDTGSVAEIFASALQQRARTRIWGAPSSGSVVMARWFPVPKLGYDYSLAIPIAGYRSTRGETLEGEGVFPQKFLYYDLGEARAGRDTWIETARRTPWTNERSASK